MKIEAIRYAFAGGINTAIGLSCIFFGLYFLELSDISANFFGYMVGLISAFFLNKFLVFQSSANSAKKSLFLFLIVFAISYTLNILTMLALHRGLHINVYLAQFAGICVYTLTGFIGNYFYAFAKQ